MLHWSDAKTIIAEVVICSRIFFIMCLYRELRNAVKICVLDAWCADSQNVLRTFFPPNAVSPKHWPSWLMSSALRQSALSLQGLSPLPSNHSSSCWCGEQSVSQDPNSHPLCEAEACCSWLLFYWRVSSLNCWCTSENSDMERFTEQLFFF